MSDTHPPKPVRERADTLGDRARFLIVTCFGLGCAPAAPGTFGALGGLAVYLLIARLAPAGHLWLTAIALALGCFAGVVLAPWAERRWRRKDPQPFVIDEVAGFLLTALIFQPGLAWGPITIAFIATRFFDILKPWPVRSIERLPAGWGIMADDLCASLYAAAALYALAALRLPLLR